MAKETFYFSHDYNARSDRKIAPLVRDYKSSGYGIYWCTAEMMHEEGGSLELDEITISAIARDLNEANEAVLQVLHDCINKYKLFTKHENQIFSSRVKQNLQGREAKKNIKKEAGKKGGISSGESRRNKNKSKQNEAVLQSNEAGEKKNEANEPKESKLKESKENNKEEKIDSNSGLPPPPLPSDLDGFNYLPDGRSYMDRTVFFTKNDFNGLPEDKNEAIRETLQVVKKIETTDAEIDILWKSFKTMNLTFQKPYRNKDDVYNHFSNWCKTQTFSKKREYNQKKQQSIGKVIGVEFLNDFTQCKMSDNSIIELTPNQRDSARFQGIKPSSIAKS